MSATEKDLLQQIDTLKKMLADSNKKLEATTKKLTESQKEVKALKLQVAARDAAAPSIYNTLSQIIDLWKRRGDDLPQVLTDEFNAICAQLPGEFENSTYGHILQRLAFHQSEKTGRAGKDKAAVEAKKARDAFEAEQKEQIRTIAVRAKRFAKTMEPVADAAVVHAANKPDDALAQAGARISLAAQPPEPEYPAPAKSPGRQAVIADNEDSPHEFKFEVRCPHCGSRHIVQGQENRLKLRSLISLLEKIEGMECFRSQNIYCHDCHKAAQITSAESLPLTPAGTLSHQLVAELAVTHANGTPLHLLQKQYFPDDAQLGKETIGKNINRWIETYLKPLYCELKHWLGKRKILVIDETLMAVLQSRGLGVCEPPAPEDLRSKDYVVAVRTPQVSAQQAILYEYCGGRSYEDISAVLNDLHPQTLITDAYRVYDTYCAEHGIRHQNCLVHLRRCILDAVKIDKLEKYLFEDGSKSNDAVAKIVDGLGKNGIVYWLVLVLQALSKIYGFERSLKRRADEKDEAYLERVRKCRRSNAKPLMQAIDTIMRKMAETHTEKHGQTYRAVNASSLADAAVCYYMNHAKQFHLFVEDPEVSPDSNAVEQSVRAVAKYRSAIGFKQSQDYAENLCILLSLVETARLNGIADPVQWLTGYSEAFYRYRVSKTLEARIEEVGEDNLAEALDPKVMEFSPGSEVGFDRSVFLRQLVGESRQQLHS